MLCRFKVLYYLWYHFCYLANLNISIKFKNVRDANLMVSLKVELKNVNK